MWWVALAAAAELEGFQRIWVDPAELVLTPVAASNSAASEALVIENPTTRRVEVAVGGVLIGRLNPREIGGIFGVPGGSYLVAITGPDGERREATLTTVASRPGLTAPAAATLPGALLPSAERRAD